MTQRKNDRQPRAIRVERVVVGRQGRVVLPAKIRAALGVEEGDELIATVEEGRLVMETFEASLARLQKRWRKIAPGRSLVDELIQERRAEAKREAQE